MKNKIILNIFLIFILILSAQLTLADELTLDLHKGWNILPITIDPDIKEIETAFAPIMDNIIIIREYTETDVQVYDPGIPPRYNTLKTIAPGKAYQIKMANAGELTLTGTQFTETSVSLHKGWNKIPYLGTETVDIEQTIESIKNNVIIIREYTTTDVAVYDPSIPSRYNTLTEFKPETGYQIKMKEKGELDFGGPTTDCTEFQRQDPDTGECIEEIISIEGKLTQEQDELIIQGDIIAVEVEEAVEEELPARQKLEKNYNRPSQDFEQNNWKPESNLIYDNKGNYQQYQPPKQRGYIIEFKTKPLLKIEQSLEQASGQAVQKALGAGSFGKLKYEKEITPYQEIKQKLQQHEQRIKSEHEQFLSTLGVQNMMTGYAVKQAQPKVRKQFTKSFNGLSLDISEQQAKEFKDSPYIKNVYPNLVVQANLQDSVPLINTPNLWEQGFTGKGMTIAVIDTGIDYTHSDLGGCTKEEFLNNECAKVIGGYDFVNTYDLNNDFDLFDCFVLDKQGEYCEKDISTDEKWVDINSDMDTGDCYTESKTGEFCELDLDPMDDGDHGTHCAGIAAANGEVKGVAPDAQLYAYKVLDARGSGSFDDVIAAIERSVDPNQDGDFSDMVDVISLSLGLGCKKRLGGFSEFCGPDDPQSTAIDNVVDAGVIAVIAAGNDGSHGIQTIGSPGTARKAITVGATTKGDWVTSFSSRGPVISENTVLLKPDIAAPGHNIRSTITDSGYDSYDGTSMAAPHVAGLAALIKQQHPEYTPIQVKNAIIKGEDIWEQYKRVDSVKVSEHDASVYVDTISIGFGVVDLSKSLWQKTETIQITNTNDKPVTYTLTLEDPYMDGVATLSYPETITIEPNSEYKFDLTLNFDNDKADEQYVDDWDYENMLTLFSSTNTIEVPIWFKRTHLELSSDKEVTNGKIKISIESFPKMQDLDITITLPDEEIISVYAYPNYHNADFEFEVKQSGKHVVSATAIDVTGSTIYGELEFTGDLDLPIIELTASEEQDIVYLKLIANEDVSPSWQFRKQLTHHNFDIEETDKPASIIISEDEVFVNYILRGPGFFMTPHAVLNFRFNPELDQVEDTTTVYDPDQLIVWLNEKFQRPNLGDSVYFDVMESLLLKDSYDNIYTLSPYTTNGALCSIGGMGLRKLDKETNKWNIINDLIYYVDACENDLAICEEYELSNYEEHKDKICDDPFKTGRFSKDIYGVRARIDKNNDIHILWGEVYGGEVNKEEGYARTYLNLFYKKIDTKGNALIEKTKIFAFNDPNKLKRYFARFNFAIDNNNDVYFVWSEAIKDSVQGYDPYMQSYYKKLSDGELDERVTINTELVSIHNIQIDKDNKIHVIYDKDHDTVDTKLYYGYLDLDNNNINYVKTIKTVSSGNKENNFVLDPNNNVYIIHEDWGEHLSLAYDFYQPSKNLWTKGTLVDEKIIDLGTNNLALDDLGNAHFVWADGRYNTGFWDARDVFYKNYINSPSVTVTDSNNNQILVDMTEQGGIWKGNFDSSGLSQDYTIKAVVTDQAGNKAYDTIEHATPKPKHSLTEKYGDKDQVILMTQDVLEEYIDSELLITGYDISSADKNILRPYDHDLIVDPQVQCSDSDDGKDYYVPGYVVEYNFHTYNDMCVEPLPPVEQEEQGGYFEYDGVWYDSTNECYYEDCYIGEAYCNDGVGFIPYKCEYGCYEGACIKRPVCTDSDVTDEFPGGFNYDQRGTIILGDEKETDWCQDLGEDGNLIELFCVDDADFGVDIGSTYYYCEHGCDDGACKEKPACIDTDGGLDYFTQGIISTDALSAEDGCHYEAGSAMSLVEFYCEQGELQSIYYSCPYTDESGNSCYEGACIDLVINQDIDNLEYISTETDSEIELKDNEVIIGRMAEYKGDFITLVQIHGFLITSESVDTLIKEVSEDEEIEFHQVSIGDNLVYKTKTGNDVWHLWYHDNKLILSGTEDVNDELYTDDKLYSLLDAYLDMYPSNVGEEDIQCVDTDSTEEFPFGLNYGERGTLTYSSTKETDTCDSPFPNTNLLEWYCAQEDDPVIEGDVGFRGYNCEYGCEDGACIEKRQQLILDLPDHKQRGDIRTKENYETTISGPQGGKFKVLRRDMVSYEPLSSQAGIQVSEYESQKAALALNANWESKDDFELREYMDNKHYYKEIPIQPPIFTISWRSDNFYIYADSYDENFLEDVMYVYFKEYPSTVGQEPVEPECIDKDEDTYYDETTCTDPELQDQLDCDDTNPDINPGELDTCNEFDHDCDGDMDTIGGKIFQDVYDDLDGKHYKYCDEGKWIEAGLCKETEICNNIIDDDCDGLIAQDDPNCADINLKNMDKYSEKQTFLISDKDWKQVLPLVPITTWTGTEDCQKGYGTPDNVCVYPTLIWHEEETSYDIDSAIYFMQQYSTDKLTIIGQTPEDLNNLLTSEPELGAGLNEKQINKIKTNDYLSYWNSYKDVVYVEDDYESALLASTYASLINAPLIIENTNLDNDNVFIDKNLICIGKVNKECYEQYTLEQLQKLYIDKTKTDKIILLNPNDLDLKVTEKLIPEKSVKPIQSLYTKTSLSAPILASAKHEIIFPIAKQEYKEIDKDLKLVIQDFTPNLINNEQGVKDNHFVTKLYKKDLNSGEDYLVYTFSNRATNLFVLGNNLLFNEREKIYLYNVETNSKEQLELEVNDWLNTDFNENQIVYTGYSRGDSKCRVYLYDLDEKKEKELFSYKGRCKNVKINDNVLVFIKPEQSVCRISEEVCISDEDCKENKFCSFSKIACQSDSDCNENEWDGCYSDFCVTKSFTLNTYDLNSKQEKSIATANNFRNLGFSGNKVLYELVDDNEQEFYLYDLSLDKKEQIIDVDFAEISNNKVLLNREQNLYLYDISTKDESLITDNFYSDTSFNNKNIIWFEDEDRTCELSQNSCIDSSNCQKYCNRNYNLCETDKDCKSYETCIKDDCEPTAIYSYDINSKEKHKISNDINAKNPLVLGNDMFYILNENNEYNIYGYLTIIGAPNAIPIREFMGFLGYGNYRSLDSSEYSDFYLSDKQPDLSVGRIQGISLSDVSGYVARDLFYDNILDTNYMEFMASSSRYKMLHSDKWSKSFSNAGYNTHCSIQPELDHGGIFNPSEIENYLCDIDNKNGNSWPPLWKNKELISYMDHGSSAWAGITSNKIPWLSNSIVYNAACSTCSTYDSSSFCNTVIRKGGLGHFGAISIAWSGNKDYKHIMEGIYYSDLDLGQAFAKSYDYNPFNFMTTFIGDPTFNPNPEYKLEGELPWKY